MCSINVPTLFRLSGLIVVCDFIPTMCLWWYTCSACVHTVCRVGSSLFDTVVIASVVYDCIVCGVGLHYINVYVVVSTGVALQRDMLPGIIAILSSNTALHTLDLIAVPLCDPPVTVESFTAKHDAAQQAQSAEEEPPKRETRAAATARRQRAAGGAGETGTDNVIPSSCF